ncbi:hypothetical protein BsWGS_22572 [Bradybaena similaris]
MDTCSRRFVVLLLLGLFAVCRSQLELDNKFLELRSQGMWLVEFYAPWCGYCKKLEPIYQEVARVLQQNESPVQVAKLDCTKYSAVANAFSIRGFPTIMFIQGDRVFTLKGDRSKDNIVEFALRAQGPAVRKLSSVEMFNDIVRQHNDSVFFIYIGDSEQEDLFKLYSQAANAFAIYSYFYYGAKNIAENVNFQRYPTVLAMKDRRTYEYEFTDGAATAASLRHFVNREQYATFPKLSGQSLNDLASVVKYLVILVVRPEDLSDPTTTSSRLFHLFEEVAFDQRVRFHSQFQFLWMDSTETVNNIAMSFLATPMFMVMETDSHLYYMTTNVSNITGPALTEYLTNVADGKEQAYGGTGILMRLKGMMFELVSLIISIWQTSRWLFCLMVGLPTFVIAVLCYSLCCMEIRDGLADSEDEDNMAEYWKRMDDELPPIQPWHGKLPPYGDESLKCTEEKKKE